MVYGFKNGGLTDKEIQEYAALCAVLKGLMEKYAERKQELIKLVMITESLRGRALKDLVKANNLTRHLTSYQRHAAGLTYNFSQLKAIKTSDNLPPALQKEDDEGAFALDFSLMEKKAPKHGSGRLELRQKELAVIKLIDNAKKKLLFLDVLELRSRELICSIEKVMKAFHYSARITHRFIYPFGVFSMFKRRMRQFFGSTYFTLRDMDSIAALGIITGSVLKVAGSPLV